MASKQGDRKTNKRIKRNQNNESNRYKKINSYPYNHFYLTALLKLIFYPILVIIHKNN